MTATAYPPGAAEPALLTDAALYAEYSAVRAQMDRDALADPLTLARHLDPQVVTRPHLRVASKAIAELEPRSGGRLMIVMPPQVGKSVLAAVWGPFWWLARHPAMRVIIGSYASHLATKRGRSIRRLVQLYGERYALALEKGTAAANDWSLESGGGIKSAGVGAGITGAPADAGVIDDPLKGRADADSPRIREKVWDWYSGDFYSRLAPGAPIVIMSTRWHEDDLIGRLLTEQGSTEQGGVWTVVYLPAMAMAVDLKAGIYPDALDRAPGEPLTHPRIKTSDLAGRQAHWTDKKTSSTPRDWGALYQGNPRPTEGALVSREVLRQRRDYFPTAVPVKHVVGVDPSGGGRSVAGVIGAWLGDDGRLYLCADRSGVMSSEQWGRAAAALAGELDADLVVVEANYGGDMAKRTVRNAWVALLRETTEALAALLAKTAVAARLDESDVDSHLKAVQQRQEHPGAALAALGIPRPSKALVEAFEAAARYRRLPPHVGLQVSKKNKLLRAEPVAQELILDRMRMAAPLPELEDEWATWQPTSPDSPGRIDASVHIALKVLPIPAAGELVSTAQEVSRSDVAAAAAAGGSAMPVIPRQGVVGGVQVVPDWR